MFYEISLFTNFVETIGWSKIPRPNMIVPDVYLQIQNNVYLGMGNRRLSGIINIGLFVALTFHTSLSNVMVHCIRLSMVCEFIFT